MPWYSALASVRCRTWAARSEGGEASPARSSQALKAASAAWKRAKAAGARWGGAFTFTFGGLLIVRALLPFEPRAVKLLLEVLCAGDVIYLASLLPFTLSYGALPLGLSPFLMTAPMFACRLSLRVLEDWSLSGIEKSEGLLVGGPNLSFR